MLDEQVSNTEQKLEVSITNEEMEVVKEYIDSRNILIEELIAENTELKNINENLEQTIQTLVMENSIKKWKYIPHEAQVTVGFAKKLFKME